MYRVLPRICLPFVMQHCALAIENRSGRNLKWRVGNSELRTQSIARAKEGGGLSRKQSKCDIRSHYASSHDITIIITCSYIDDAMLLITYIATAIWNVWDVTYYRTTVRVDETIMFCCHAYQ